MKSVIATLIISTLILGLALVGIQLWRNNLELIGLAAARVDSLEKIKATQLISLEASQRTGSEVISVIRYYRNNANVAITVVLPQGSKTYRGEEYIRSQFPISYEAKFQQEVEYVDAKVSKITFVQN